MRPQLAAQEDQDNSTGWADGGEGGQSVPAPSFISLASLSSALPPPAAGSGTRAAPPGAPPPPPALRVLVVGGSMAGSCAALALLGAGCEVHVLERSHELRSQGAGLVIQPDMAAFLQRYEVAPRLEDLCVKSAGRQYIGRDERVLGGDANPQLFCAWDVLFRALKQKVPAAAYHSGCKVVAVSASGQGVRVEVESAGGSGEEEEESALERYEGDLLVGADGPGSIVRAHFCPGVTSEYQGYAAWRGVVPEADAPARVLGFIGNKFTVYQGRAFHFLCYPIPGELGEVRVGQRRVNWVWYENTPQAELEALMRDRQGRQHGYSVPRGLLREEVAQERRRVAKEVLPGVLAELVGATQDIFLQAIHDMLAPALAFQGRACLTGDAGCILRPHTAAGTTKAAVNAAALAGCLQSHSYDLAPALQDYSASQLELARYLVDVGVRIGTRSQFPEQS